MFFGTRGVTTTAGTGAFICPKCGPGSAYGLQRVRRKLVLFAIPVMALDTAGEYVECAGCQSTWEPSVLDHRPEVQATETALEANVETAIKRVMMLMTLADGVVADAEIATIISVYQRLTGDQLDEGRLRARVEGAAQVTETVTDCLTEVAPHLNEPGKEMVIKAMYLVATADGEFHSKERKLLAEAGRALEMSEDHVSGVIEEIGRAA